MATIKQALTRLTELVTEGKAAREGLTDSPERKAGQAAKVAARHLRDLDSDKYADTVKVLESIGSGLGASLTDLIPVSEGNALADRITKVTELDSDDQPNNFDPVAALALVTEWKAVAGRRGGPRGDGSHSTPPGQWTNCPVRMDFDYPESYEGDYRRTSTQGKRSGRVTYSSLSNEITQAAKAVLGVETRPAEAKAEWQAISKALKALDTAPDDETVVGTVTYTDPTGGEMNMTATITALPA